MSAASLVAWEPRWTSPEVESTCPSCGLRCARRASSWAQRNGVLIARFACDFTAPVWADRDCYRVFDEEIELT